MRQIYQLWDRIPRASSTVSAFSTFILKWLDDKRAQFIFWIQGEKIFWIKLFLLGSYISFLTKMQNKAQVFSLPLSKTSIMIDFHCIFSFHEWIFQAKLFLLLLLLMAPEGSGNLSLLREQPADPDREGKEVVWVSNEGRARASHGGRREARWIG